MTKILLQPESITDIDKYSKKDIGGFIIGIDNFSIFQSLKLNVEDIKSLNVNGKELYISLNKPIHNSEISDITNILILLSKLDISGIIFEDIAIYNIVKKMGLNLNLIWGSMHLPTNSKSCNFWAKKGCTGALLSTDIMLSDYINIKKNTNMIIMVYLYGHIPISESSRTLITNYLKYTNKSSNSKYFNLYEKGRDKFYPIYEEYGNTFILEDVLDGINVVDELVSNNIDYIVLNSLFTHNFDLIVDDYISAVKGKKFLKKDVYTGFLFKESIFKVK